MKHTLITLLALAPLLSLASSQNANRPLEEELQENSELMRLWRKAGEEIKARGDIDLMLEHRGDPGKSLVVAYFCEADSSSCSPRNFEFPEEVFEYTSESLSQGLRRIFEKVRYGALKAHVLLTNEEFVSLTGALRTVWIIHGKRPKAADSAIEAWIKPASRRK